MGRIYLNPKLGHVESLLVLVRRLGDITTHCTYNPMMTTPGDLVVIKLDPLSSGAWSKQ